jgi:hypothetical protein
MALLGIVNWVAPRVRMFKLLNGHDILDTSPVLTTLVTKGLTERKILAIGKKNTNGNLFLPHCLTDGGIWGACRGSETTTWIQGWFKMSAVAPRQLHT